MATTRLALVAALDGGGGEEVQECSLRVRKPRYRVRGTAPSKAELGGRQSSRQRSLAGNPALQ